MDTLQNRHDLTNAQWQKIEPIIKEKLGNWGGSNASDNRVFVNSCLWIIRTGARWCDKGIWEYILAEIIDDPDMDWNG